MSDTEFDYSLPVIDYAACLSKTDDVADDGIFKVTGDSLFIQVYVGNRRFTDAEAQVILEAREAFAAVIARHPDAFSAPYGMDYGWGKQFSDAARERVAPDGDDCGGAS
jgi:hypothetical protein